MARKERIKVDAQAEITDAIIAMIESGDTDGWVRPWAKLLNGGHYCPATQRAYEGFTNIFALNVQSMTRGFASQAWGTFKQWQSLGTEDSPVCVRKGEKAVYIFVPLIFKKKDKSGAVLVNSAGQEQKGLAFTQKAVFNASQVDGYEEVKPEMPVSAVVDDAKVDKFINNLGVAINYGGDRAFYSPTGDAIGMPDREAFMATPTSTATESFYSTLLHEATHATGHESRCKRPLMNVRGGEEYAKEELIAEMGAAILCNMFGISDSPRADHAQYIKNWLQALKGDKKYIFQAVAKAQQAIKWMDGKQPVSVMGIDREAA